MKEAAIPHQANGVMRIRRRDKWYDVGGERIDLS
jgi:hypothetical protein